MARVSRTGSAFREIARRHGDDAMVGVAVTVTLDEEKRCQEARTVFLTVGEGPVEARQAEELLTGKAAGKELIRETSVTAAERTSTFPTTTLFMKGRT